METGKISDWEIEFDSRTRVEYKDDEVVYVGDLLSEGDGPGFYHLDGELVKEYIKELLAKEVKEAYEKGRKDLLKEIDEEQAGELCRCGHGKESHWWNGAGNPDASGYDLCLDENCKCRRFNPVSSPQ